MLSKKLVATLGVLAATALTPTTVAHAGTQVGSEGIRAPQADGIIAILIGAVSSPAAPASERRASASPGDPREPAPYAWRSASDRF